jgi:hypothetical protein
MGLYNSDRNNGYGRSMSAAAKNAINERFGGGSFASQAAHNDRAKAFISDCKENGIRSFDQVTNEDLKAYGSRLSDAVQRGEISVATAQNRLSTANVILEKTNPNDVRISPSQAVGERSTVRTEAPTGLDKNDVSRATEAMREAGLNRAASVTELSREFGVREREAACANLDRWRQEAAEKGAVNVVDACKGGRDADRWIRVTPSAQAALDRAIEARTEGSRNLIDKNQTFKEFKQQQLDPARSHLKDANIKGYHDLRAAWACDRYREITGNNAPCISGKIEDREADKNARSSIGNELGHNREDVCAAYIGGRGR